MNQFAILLSTLYLLVVAPGVRAQPANQRTSFDATFTTRRVVRNMHSVANPIARRACPPTGVDDAVTITVRRATELRLAMFETARRVETLRSIAGSRQPFDARQLARELEAAEAELEAHRDELSTRLRLLVLEVEDSRQLLARIDRQRRRVGLLHEDGTVSDLELESTDRQLDRAKFRRHRSRELLSLYQRVEEATTVDSDDGQRNARP